MAVHPTDPRDPGSPLEEGQTFHGLKIKALVAQGGMGVVYRARAPGSDRDVALKILPPALAAEEEFRLRFDREARALAGLSHPQIVCLHDYGVEHHLMFLVMEFVEGQSLRQVLRERKVAPSRAVAILMELCKALEFAHKERVIHRDVKPENILIDPSGHVKLTDFGLAIRMDAESARVTQTNFAVGTPHYMAPEQLERPAEVDHRADIYSLGVVLYEMLTQELPIGRFPVPSSRAAIDPAFDALVCRCLEKDPDSRYPSVADLRGALSAVPGAPRSAGPPPLPARPKISSNLELRCPCGWQFFIPAGAFAAVHCPSCGERVALEARTPPPAAVPTPLPALPNARASLIKLGIAASTLVLLGGGLLMVALRPAASRRPALTPEISFQPPAAPPATPPPAVRETAPRTAAPVAARILVPPADLRRRLETLAIEANMTGVIATILLNSGRPQDHDQLHEQLAATDQELREILLELEEQGHVVPAPDRFQSGDRLLSIAGKRMEPARTLAFADELRTWLRGFHPGVSGEVIVSRKKQVISFAFQFPERTPNLVAIARQAGVTLGETPGYVPSPAEPRPAIQAPLPASLLENLRGRLSTLPKGYRDLVPYEDRGRADALLLAGQGTSEDTMFLTGRFSDMIGRAEDEFRRIVARMRELESRIAESAAQMDAVLCKDGRRVEGTILEDTPLQVKVKARFGAVTIGRDEIQRIEKGKGSASEFRTAYDAAGGRRSELHRLLAFAKERKLVPQAELAALSLVSQDPADLHDRAEAGLPRTPWSAVAESEPAPGSGRIDYLGRSFTPEQFRLELKSLGYVLLNGIWCEKVSKSVKIDSLYRDEAKIPVIHRGTSIQSQTHSEHETYYDVQTKSWVPRTKKVADARYIGGSGGSCVLEVAAPGDLIEARVHARSQVPKAGGSVTVSVVLDPLESSGKVLYTIAAPGENDGSYDATDKVAGSSRFYVRAQIGGSGMFLVSDSNDLGVFEVKYVYGRPLERVNALLAGSMPVAEGPLSPDPKSTPESVEACCRTAAASASQLDTLVDSLAEVRRRTEGLLYPRDYALPGRFLDVGSQLKDPLDPDWNSLSRDQAMGLGTWWGRLPAVDRREFLLSYGLWCARARCLRAPR
jgi:hypothetical protein